MDTRLQTLWDHHEIRQLLATYCTGCDRADTARMAATYCEESWDDHGPDKGPGKSFATLTTARVAAVETCHHHLGQSQISVTGDEARAETYFIATVQHGGEKAGHLHQLGGRYVDRLVRQEDGWKIRDRICVRDWSISHPIAADWLEQAGFVAGRTDGADPVFAALGLTHGGSPAPAV